MAHVALGEVLARRLAAQERAPALFALPCTVLDDLPKDGTVEMADNWQMYPERNIESQWSTLVTKQQVTP